jgi:assimilatory nitrate reductase catalytic subunit
VDVARIPEQNSLAYDQIIAGIESGQIKGLWIVATNSAHSWINQRSVTDVLNKLEFLVVQDIYHTTDTARRAHLVLPAAGWGEKEGTFINSERRIGLVKKVARAPGQALADFNIFRLIASSWGCGAMFEKWQSPEAVFQILKELSRGQPCEITGIRDYEMIDAAGGIQWPYIPGSVGVLPNASGMIAACGGPLNESAVQDAQHGGQDAHSTWDNERRLFEDGRFFHADGKARFLFDEPRETPEPTCAEFPFTLLTGRGTSAQWHTQTRTAKSAVLRKLYPENIYVEINPEDAEKLGIMPNEMARISSRRGAITARAFVTPTVQAGQIFIPMHYEETNRLTFSAFDPHSRQPSYKACAVALARAER